MRPEPSQVDPERLRSLFEALLEVHREDVRLAGRLMRARESVERLERLAGVAIDCAVEAADPEAVERAVSVAAAALRASDDESAAAADWALHLERSSEIAGTADEIVRLLGNFDSRPAIRLKR